MKTFSENFNVIIDYIGIIFSRLRQETAERTDARIQMINEIVPAIRVIKMYAWEKHFLKLIRLYRSMEIKMIRRTSYLRSFNITLSYISSKLMIFPTLVVFVFMQNELTPAKVCDSFFGQNYFTLVPCHRFFLQLLCLITYARQCPATFQRPFKQQLRLWSQ